jgi:hypothetical protein
MQNESLAIAEILYLDNELFAPTLGSVPSSGGATCGLHQGNGFFPTLASPRERRELLTDGRKGVSRRGNDGDESLPRMVPKH